MKDEVSVNAITIKGKDFILIETIDKYNFFVEEKNIENICILKEIEENNESFYVNVDENEFDKALSLYYGKLKEYN